ERLRSAGGSWVSSREGMCCGYVSWDGACGDGVFTPSGELVEILCFSHFTRYMTFSPTGKKSRGRTA
ncbi:MAG: hypothetical protein ACI4DW_01740, partial [Lachnospiraceae bacterium]